MIIQKLASRSSSSTWAAQVVMSGHQNSKHSSIMTMMFLIIVALSSYPVVPAFSHSSTLIFQPPRSHNLLRAVTLTSSTVSQKSLQSQDYPICSVGNGHTASPKTTAAIAYNSYRHCWKILIHRLSWNTRLSITGSNHCCYTYQDLTEQY